jgi:branched-chain amino acid transport system permease protein
MELASELDGGGRRPAPLRPEELRFALLAGAGTLSFLLLVFVLYPAPSAVLGLGVVLGSLNALTAMGLVLIYRANRIVNFAQADMGGLAAVLAASLIVGPKWGFFPAMAVGLLAALTLGALTEVAIVRRFAKAPRLLLTVATVGIAQLLAGFTLALPRLFDYDTAPQPPRPFGSFKLEWFPVTYTGGSLLIVIVVPLIALGLATFFRRTRFGVAVRASAESADRAALLGIPVARLNTLVWVLAAGLSGMAVLLRMPIQGVAIGGTFGLTLLLRALAAAVIGRMENLPVTFCAAILIGVVDQVVFFESSRTVVVDAVLLLVILAGLLSQRRGGLERARELGASTWQAVREVRPIPAELRGLPEVRWSLGIGKVVLVALVVLIPLRLSGGDVFTYSIALIFAMLMCSLVVLTGWAGQISLGQLAIAAIGAAVAGTLHFQDRDFFLTLAVAGLVGAGIAVALGIPALRIQGPFLAVTTLAFAVATGTFFLNREYFPWLVPDPSRLLVRPVIFGKFDLESEHTFFMVTLAVLGLTIASVLRLQRSRTGRTLVANRDNTRAAQSYGISPVRAQLTAFGLSGFIAGLAGGLYVFALRGISSSVLDPYNNLKVFAIGVLGGLGSVPGALLGAAYLAFVDLSSFTREPMAQLLASGIGVLLILMIFPGGLGGLVYDTRDRLLRALARARGIVVPSLLADVRSTTPSSTTRWRSRCCHGPRRRRTRCSTCASSTSPTGDPGALRGRLPRGARARSWPCSAPTGPASRRCCAHLGLVEPTAGAIVFDGRRHLASTPTRGRAPGRRADARRQGRVPHPHGGGELQLAGWLFHRIPSTSAATTRAVLEHFPVLRDRWARRPATSPAASSRCSRSGWRFIAKPKLLHDRRAQPGPGARSSWSACSRSSAAIHGPGHHGHAGRAVGQRGHHAGGPGGVHGEGRGALRRSHRRAAGSSRDPPGGLPPGRRRPRRATATEPAGPGGRCGSASRSSRTATRAARPRSWRSRPGTPRVNFGGIKAVNGVDLSVHEGQILGLIGPNGAGKTTIFDLISGFVTPSTGRVILGGRDITDLTPDARAVQGLGRSFQDARLFPSMTVRQTISVALERHIATRDALAAALMSPATRMAERKVEADVDRLIELMHLEAFADKFVGELSTGSRRVVDLACTLAHGPEVLLLDEPSSGIAQRETEALGPLLLDIREKTGAALIVIEHDMPLITSISDELVALELGAVVVRGEPDAVVNDPRVIEGYLGGDEIVISDPAARQQARAAARPGAGSPSRQAGGDPARAVGGAPSGP